MPNKPLTPPKDSPDASFTTAASPQQPRFPPSPQPASDRAGLESGIHQRAISENRRVCTARSLLKRIRKYHRQQQFSSVSYLISPREFRNLEASIEALPDSDPLKAFWEEELHWEYDSSTTEFRVLMSTEIHERLGVSIREQLNYWLTELKKHDSVCIREYASSVIEVASARIKYSSMQDLEPVSIEEIVGASSSSESVSDPPYLENTRPSSVAPTSSRSLRSHYAGTSRNLTAAAESEGVPPITEASQSGTIEKRYVPDVSWRFKSAQAKDKRPAFVIETAKTQREDGLRAKIEGLLGTCDASVVLVCRTDVSRSKRAYVQLWRSSPEAQNAAQPVWAIDIVDDQGAVPGHFEPAPVKLAYFASRNSASRFLRQYTDEEIDMFFQQSIVLDFAKLGDELVKLREEERFERESETRKRDWDETDGEVDDRELRIRRKFEAEV